MTPERFNECLAALRWTKRLLGDALRCDEGTVRQWARGTRPVPATVATWLDRLAKHHERFPPPDAPVTAFLGPGAAERKAAAMGVDEAK